MNNQTFQKVWSTSRKEITYQPDRTEAVHITVTFFSERIDWEVSTDQIRQFNCRLIYKQRGRNKTAQSPLYSLGSLEPSYSKQHFHTAGKILPTRA